MDDFRRKLKTLKALKTLVRNRRGRGEKIVLANGCFDLLHVGHIRYLADAKAMGDVLIVGINGDRSVRRLKGKGRPLMPQSARAELISGLEFTDYAVIFPETTAERLLRTLRPDVHVKGGDYTADTVPEREVVRSYGGRVAIAGGPKVRSTREVIRKVRSFRKKKA